MLKIAILIKDQNGRILNSQQTTKVIDEVKSNINPECRFNFLDYSIKKGNVFIKKEDLFILEIRLSKLNYKVITQTDQTS